MLLEEKKRLHDDDQERRIIQASEDNPFQALTIRQPLFPRDIPMQTWENHFSKMLNKHEIAFEATKDQPIPVFNPFTESETADIITGNKNSCRPRRYLQRASEDIAAAVAESMDKYVQQVYVPWHHP
jgi:hypothetical protein